MATTPTLREPANSVTGIRLRGRISFHWSPYEDGASLTTVRLRIKLSGVVVWDSYDIEPDDHMCGDGWMDVFVELIPVAELTAYTWDVRIQDDTPSTSSYSSAFTFTTEAAEQDTSRWREAQ